MAFGVPCCGRERPIEKVLQRNDADGSESDPRRHAKHSNV